jgi:hypothetical protein
MRTPFGFSLLTGIALFTRPRIPKSLRGGVRRRLFLARLPALRPRAEDEREVLVGQDRAQPEP